MYSKYTLSHVEKSLSHLRCFNSMNSLFLLLSEGVIQV